MGPLSKLIPPGVNAITPGNQLLVAHSGNAPILVFQMEKVDDVTRYPHILAITVDASPHEVAHKSEGNSWYTSRV